jgi:DNA-binding beta-propeller fold protein YncE
VLLAVPLLAACAGGPARDDALRLRWPEPPLEARIEYVRSIRTSQDVEGEPTVWQRIAHFLTGAEPDRWPIAHPADMTVSHDGETVYVSDFAQGVVHVFDLARATVRHFGDVQRLERPFGVAVDSARNLYVVEQAARQVRVLDDAGETLRVIRSDRLIRPTDVALDEARGRLYVADPSRQRSPDHAVRIFNLEGTYLGDIGRGRGTGDGYLLFPTYVSLDAKGLVYVSDTLNSRVSVFRPDGEFVRAIGARGDGPGQFDKPKGVALDAFGNLYVVDSSWSNVQIFGPQDDVLLFFGGRGNHPGLLHNPTSIAIDPTDNTIYVGDYLNHRISVYRLVNTHAGDGLPSAASARTEAVSVPLEQVQ